MGYLSKENKNTNLKRYMHSHIHCRIIQKSQDIEATLVSIKEWIDKENMVCIYTMEIYSAI